MTMTANGSDGGGEAVDDDGDNDECRLQRKTEKNQERGTRGSDFIVGSW